MNGKTKRRSIAAGILLVLALAAGGAYAYWTNSGDGTGSASTGNGGTDQLTVTQTGSITNLRPGGAAQAITGTISNASDADVRVASVSVSLADTTWQPGCSASDYTVSGSPLSVNQDITAGGSISLPAGLTVQFNNTGSNQDGCKDQALVLSFTVS